MKNAKRLSFAARIAAALGESLAETAALNVQVLVTCAKCTGPVGKSNALRFGTPITRVASHAGINALPALDVVR